MLTITRPGLLAAAGLTAVATLASPAVADAGQKIAPESFGIHSFSTDPQVRAGSIRMNMSPSWRILNPRKGQYNWAAMNAKMAQMDAWGMTDRLYVFGGTPKWAAGPVQWPDRELFPGSAAAPKKMSYWQDFVTEVVRRYGAKIDSYQAWNEITSPQFYQGTAAQMAAMTKILNDVVNRLDPTAQVVSGSVQTHAQAYYDRMALPYFSEMRKLGWPADVIAGHFYPAAKGGPDQRVTQIEMFKRDLKRNKAPKSRDLWDTEANFWTTVPGGAPNGRVTGKKAATYVARNYLDTWRLGLKRSYWYLWSSEYVQFAGVQMRPGDAGTKAYQTLATWATGAKFKKCSQKGTLMTCAFTKSGSSFTVAFTTKGKATYSFSGKKQICPVTGSSCSTAKKKAKVTTLPIRVA